jgi:hypothetical protein
VLKATVGIPRAERVGGVGVADGQDSVVALARRRAAAERYRPQRIQLLLVAEAPPSELARYFYFEDVKAHDSLFLNVCEVLLNRRPTRREKAKALEDLKATGVFLIDLKETPVDGSDLSAYVAGLLQRCAELSPERIVLIKVTVYDTAFTAMKRAGLPVVDARLPFPGGFQQPKFRADFRAALEVARGESE